MSIFKMFGEETNVESTMETPKKPKTLLEAAIAQEEARTKDKLVEDPEQPGTFVTEGELRDRKKGPIKPYQPFTDTTTPHMPIGS